MRIRQIAFFIFTTFALLLHSSLASPQEVSWVKQLDKKGIVVYVRSFPQSPIKEFKAQTKIKAPISKIVALIKDFKSYSQWIYASEGTYLIQNKGDKEFIYYTRIKLPKPIEDRDLVVQMKITELSDNRCVIKSVGLPKFISEKPKIIRIKHYQGMWELVRINNNETMVSMQSHTDPEGEIPPWLINSMLTNGPYETLEKMNKMLMTK